MTEYGPTFGIVQSCFSIFYTQAKYWSTFKNWKTNIKYFNGLGNLQSISKTKANQSFIVPK